jgi:hypothetical protein
VGNQGAEFLMIAELNPWNSVKLVNLAGVGGADPKLINVL